MIWSYRYHFLQPFSLSNPHSRSSNVNISARSLKELSASFKIPPNIFQKIFRTRVQKEQTGQDPTRLMSPRRLDIFLRVLITIIAAVLLLAPVIILVQLQPNEPSQVTRRNWLQIVTIFLFTLAFSSSCSIFTRARRQEVFTATAAYCAVLVVFLGNTSNVIVISNHTAI